MKIASAVTPFTANTRYISCAPTMVSATAPPITISRRSPIARGELGGRVACGGAARSDWVGMPSGASSGSARNAVAVRLSNGTARFR